MVNCEWFKINQDSLPSLEWGSIFLKWVGAWGLWKKINLE